MDSSPWREITTDDYWKYRLRLILREAVDLKRGPKANPLWYWDYDAGPPAITSVAETWIQLNDGRRHVWKRTGSRVEIRKLDAASQRRGVAKRTGGRDGAANTERF